MKIGIDIDNVIAHTFQDLVVYFNSFMGKNHSPNEVLERMRKDRLKMLAYWWSTWRRGLLKQVSPIEEAVAAIREWHPSHSISLVTSRLPIFNRQTKEWLKKHQIPFHELHHAKETTKHKKAPNCRVFIEDNLKECETLADHCEKVFLLDYPWNRGEIKKKNIIRVNNWGEIQEHFRHLHPH